jgi:hypothetical protein
MYDASRVRVNQIDEEIGHVFFLGLDYVASLFFLNSLCDSYVKS